MPSRTKTMLSGSAASADPSGGACTVKVDMAATLQPVRPVARGCALPDLPGWDGRMQDDASERLPVPALPRPLAPGETRQRRSSAQGTLGRRDLVLVTGIDGDRTGKRPRQAFEARLGDMVVIGPVERLHMQRYAGVRREGPEPLLHQFRVETAHLVAGENGLEHEKRTPGYVERDAGQRLVHRNMHVGIARDALHVTERLPDRLAERDAHVLGGVMMIDVEVALGLDRDVNARMPRQQVEHMVEEADAGGNARPAGAVEIDGDLDRGLLGVALDGGLSHVQARSDFVLFNRA